MAGDGGKETAAASIPAQICSITTGASFHPSGHPDMA